MKKTIRTSTWMLIIASLFFVIYSCTKEEISISPPYVAPTELRLFKVEQTELIAPGKIAHVDDVALIQDLIDTGKLTGDLVKATSSTIDRESDKFQYLIVRGENAFNESMFSAYPVNILSDGTINLIIAAAVATCTGQATCQHCDVVKNGDEIVGCDCQSANGWCKYKSCKTEKKLKLCCTSMEKCQKCDFTRDSAGVLEGCNCTSPAGWCQPQLTVLKKAVVVEGQN